MALGGGPVVPCSAGSPVAQGQVLQGVSPALFPVSWLLCPSLQLSAEALCVLWVVFGPSCGMARINKVCACLFAK